MANVYAGEVGITCDGRDYLFRPSLAAMASMGEPDELGELLIRVQRPDVGGFLAAMNVMAACYAGSDDIDKLIGHIREIKGKLRYVKGAMPQDEIHIIGAQLAVSGMVGKPKRSGKGGGSTAFDPGAFVGVAAAHLGVPSAAAWQMTMMELQQVLDAKYPPEDEDDALTQEDVQATIDRVTAARNRS